MDKRFLIGAVISMLMLIFAGCSGRVPERLDIESTPAGNISSFATENDSFEEESISAILRDVIAETPSPQTNLDTRRRMVNRLGENGYPAVDSENQINMTRAEQVLEFCKAVEEKENAEVTIIVITEQGFRKLDLETEKGEVTVTRTVYRYGQDGHLQKQDMVSYPVDFWQYTQDGYLLFEGSYFSDEDFVLTLNDVTEHTALRVLPLDEKCREWNRKYILPVGYRQNNLFLCNWSEEDYGELDFYDLFDKFYKELYGQPVPYAADENLDTGAVYQIPEKTFEAVIRSYFNVEHQALCSKTKYLSEECSYEYRPRGFHEAEYPEIPYPEVVSYIENPDGTLTLNVHAVYPNGNSSREFSHTTVVRPIDEERFQYVSNEISFSKDEDDFWWHSERLTEEEWEEVYGENEGNGENSEGGSGHTEADAKENKAQSELWMLPKAEHCLFTEAEREELMNMALAAAEEAKEAYQEIEIVDDLPFSSNIKEFSERQCREVVTLLGNAGYVSVTENTNMENYEKVEDFYVAYTEKQDAIVTIFDVKRDGLLSVTTFLYRDSRLQTYYVGIGWQEGGIPEVRNTLVSDIAEIKVTPKGYFIYAHTDDMVYSSLRQCWRIKPLSDKCRELTAKYIHGLSYVNYNVLVTNWDSSNVEDILMPCMFEDIYRIYTGENLKTQNGKIPAETYEKIMTTYFPVSVEQIREKCGYDEDSDSYEYEMIFSSPYPPFGEVVDYTYNSDGTITLLVDAVWADYNSDLAFTNTIVVQPFEDGTFRYLSDRKSVV